VVAVLLIVVHGFVAPAGFMWRAAAPLGPRALVAQLFLTEPLDGRVAEQDLIIVNPPVAFACMATPLIWASEKAPLPRHIRILASSAFLPVEVKRLDEYTLEVRPAAGYLATKMDRLCRRDDRPLRAGEEVELPGMVATVLEAGADGRPRSVAFRFPVRLEDASLRWLKWHAGEFVAFEPPRPGEAVELRASWREIFQAATR
jgi:hypothetical protein